MHGSHVCIDARREGQKVLNGPGLIHLRLVSIIQLLIVAAVHTIFLEQVDLRFKLTQFGSADIGQCFNRGHHCLLVLCVYQRAKFVKFT